MAVPFAAAAMRVGSLIAKGGQAFKTGARAVGDTAKSTVGRTKEKIKKQNKVLKQERAAQESFKKKVNEEIEKREKEGEIERKKGGKRQSLNLVNNFVQKPLEALARFIAAWAMKNLPPIIKEVEIFTKKVRVTLAAVKNTFLAVKGVASSMVKVTVALIKNIASFDFNDTSGRIKEAQEEYDESMEEFSAGISEFGNVWSRSEDELDEMLKELDDGGKFSTAVDKALVEKQRGERAPAQPQTTVDGTTIPSVRKGDKFDPNTRALLNTIRYAEGTAGPEGYNTWFGGRTDMDLAKMTITEVVEEQRRRISSGEATYGKYTSAAVGAYQIMKPEKAAKTAGLNPDTTYFTPDVQDTLAIEAFLKGQAGLSTEEIQAPISKQQIAKIAPVWASLPDASGKSVYGQPVKSFENLQGVYSQNQQAAQTQQAQPQQQTQSPTPSPKSGGGTTTPSAVVDEANVSKNQHATIGVTSGFGMRWGRMHKGVDIGTSGQRGVLVGMRAQGRVTTVANDPSGWGNYCIIYVPSLGMSFLFGHMAKIFVKQGQAYNGEAIGEIGNTGRSTGEHLHFEAIVGSSANGKRVDPTQYLPYLSVGTKTKTMATATTIQSSPNLTAKAEETSTKVGEKRTVTNRRGRQVVIIKQTEVVMT